MAQELLTVRGSGSGSDKTGIVVEEGNEVRVRCFGILKKTGKAKNGHVVEHAAVFPFGDTAVQPLNAYIVARHVLPHEADRNPGRKVVLYPVQDLHAFSGEAGQDKVTDKNTPDHDAFIVVFGKPFLSAHLCDCGRGGGKILRRAGAQAAHTG